MELNKIYFEDCLDGMKNLPDQSIDLILCDLPYGGKTALAWDVALPFADLWEQYERLIKPTSVIALFGSQPFTANLIMSKPELFKYCYYWIKTKPSGWQHAKNKPMSKVEEICIFSKAPMGHSSLLGERRMRYNPQGLELGEEKVVSESWFGRMMGARPNQVGKKYRCYTGYPNNVLNYPNVVGKKASHPTEKPVELCEYIIKTFTEAGDVVLDNCIGSGTTAIAAIRTGRNYIGFETEKEYVELAERRIEEAKESIGGGNH